MATYKPDHVGFGRLMKSPEISGMLRGEADRVANHMRATAPRQSGEYASNFGVDVGLDVRRRDRAAAFVYNDTRYALALEFGTSMMQNPPRPMTRALNELSQRR